MKDLLGERMKERYEDRTRYYLPRRTYTIIRIDGKAFHTFTRGFSRPFDSDLMTMMDSTAKDICVEVMGVKLAYVQSDEISLVLTDFEKDSTEAWFDGNIQKMISVVASIATASFNDQIRKQISTVASTYYRDLDYPKHLDKFGNPGFGNGLKTALFDARVFTIPDRVEVENYLIWRQMDATKNSILSVGQANFSHKELHGQNTSKIQDMLMLQKGINWNDFSAGEKRGRLITKQFYDKAGTQRSKWDNEECPIFTSDIGRERLHSLIPKISDYE